MSDVVAEDGLKQRPYASGRAPARGDSGASQEEEWIDAKGRLRVRVRVCHFCFCIISIESCGAQSPGARFEFARDVSPGRPRGPQEEETTTRQR
jgi:hypothetical protein